MYLVSPSTVTVTATALPDANTRAGDRSNSSARIAAIILGAVLFVAFLVIAGMARTIRRQRAGIVFDPAQADTPFLPKPLSIWGGGTADHAAVPSQPYTPTPFPPSARSVPPQEASAISYNSMHLQQGQPPSWVLSSAQSMPADYSAGQGQAMSELSVGGGGSVVGGKSAPPAYQSVSGDMM